MILHQSSSTSNSDVTVVCLTWRTDIKWTEVTGSDSRDLIQPLEFSGNPWRWTQSRPQTIRMFYKPGRGFFLVFFFLMGIHAVLCLSATGPHVKLHIKSESFKFLHVKGLRSFKYHANQHQMPDPEIWPQIKWKWFVCWNFLTCLSLLFDRAIYCIYRCDAFMWRRKLNYEYSLCTGLIMYRMSNDYLQMYRKDCSRSLLDSYLSYIWGNTYFHVIRMFFYGL